MVTVKLKNLQADKTESLLWDEYTVLSDNNEDTSNVLDMLKRLGAYIPNDLDN
jgi:hypothetical protein